MKPRLVMLLPHYPPQVAADGQLFALLARELVRSGLDVRVLTWNTGYQGLTGDAPARETVDGVEVHRMWAPRAGKSLVGRALGAAWLLVTGFLRAALHRGVLLTPSSPPTMGLVTWLWALFGRHTVYVLHDIHPDLGLALGRIRPGPAAAILRFIQRRALAAGQTVTITEGMAERARQIQPRAKVQVIENWVDIAAISPRPKAASRFAREHGLLEPFVVQYSGNLGLLHPLDGLTGAMARLPGCVLCYIGRGARLEATRESAAGSDNVRFFDYQPLADLADSLCACDLAVVALEPGADRLAMPSKLVGILASGRPVLVLAPAESELAQLVTANGCGVVVTAFNDPEAVASAIDELRRDPARVRDMSRRARELAVRQFALSQAVVAYRDLVAVDELNSNAT